MSDALGAPAISNTTVISNFAAIGELDALCKVYGQLFLSTHVYEEIRAGLEGAYRFLEAVDQVLDPPNTGGWLRLTGLEGQNELRYFRECPLSLHAGEASCIAIARQRGWMLLTDDRAARAEARRLGLRLSGTLGTLVQVVERSVAPMDVANEWLRRMVNQRYRSPVSDLSELLER